MHYHLDQTSKIFILVQHLPGFPALDWDWLGYKAEKGSSASTVLKRLKPPDMLIWAEGATVYIGENEDKVCTS